MITVVQFYSFKILQSQRNYVFQFLNVYIGLPACKQPINRRSDEMFFRFRVVIHYFLPLIKLQTILLFQLIDFSESLGLEFLSYCSNKFTRSQSHHLQLGKIDEFLSMKVNNQHFKVIQYKARNNLLT